MRELTALQNFVPYLQEIYHFGKKIAFQAILACLGPWQQPRSSQGCGKMRDPGNEVAMAAKKRI